MRGQKPPRPHSAKATRVPSYDAVLAANRDRRDGSVRNRARPVSAQAARRDGSPGNVIGEKTLAILQLKEKCMELKRTGNSLNEDNTKNGTRLAALKRELKRRARLLQQMVKLSESGQCMDMDTIEKLREERNMLPIVQKRAQDLQHEVEKKDAAIRGLKHDPEFTRTIELQVEYATWQHEARRLESLMNNPDTSTNIDAEQEVAVHRRRNEKLDKQLKAEKERLQHAEDDLREQKEAYKYTCSQKAEKEKELLDMQKEYNELTTSLMTVLQKRKQLEEQQAEIDALRVDIAKWTKEEQSLSEEAASVYSAPQELGWHTVPEDLVHGALPTSTTTSVLNALRRTTASRTGQESLFAEFLRRDKDATGTLSPAEFFDVFAKFGLNAESLEKSRLIELITGQSSAQSIPWLDFLVLLDRSASTVPHISRPPLPDIRPLRAACLRGKIDVEDFRSQLAAISTRSQAEVFFKGLTRSNAVASTWTSAWEAYGADGLLLRLPLGEVAPRKEDVEAWNVRCLQAINIKRKDLEDSLRVWPDAKGMFTRDRFRTVCMDDKVGLGEYLSSDDIDDLWLFINGGHGGPSDVVDGKHLLNFNLLNFDQLREVNAAP